MGQARDVDKIKKGCMLWQMRCRAQIPIPTSRSFLELFLSLLELLLVIILVRFALHLSSQLDQLVCAKVEPQFLLLLAKSLLGSFYCNHAQLQEASSVQHFRHSERASVLKQLITPVPYFLVSFPPVPS